MERGNMSKERRESIIPGGNDHECWVCGRTVNLELHHCIHGTANRTLADKYGLYVYLCPACHRGTNGVHGKNGHQRDVTLKNVAQRAWEAVYGSREEFRAIFGKSFIDDDTKPEIEREGRCDGC